MAKKGIRIKVDDDGLNLMLNQVINLPLKAIHSSIGEEMIAIIENRFDESKDPKGGRWPAIKDYVYKVGSVSVKRKAGQPPLKGGLGSPPLARSFEFDADEDKVDIGTGAEYSIYHSDFPKNNGRRRTKIKRREFMGLESPRDIDLIVGIVDDAIGVLVRN